MKIKVKELLEQKDRADSVKSRVDHLPSYRDDKITDEYLLDGDDVESVSAELEEYIELLDKLIEATKLNL